MSRITVVPAYGRDYKSKSEIEADWDAGKDFTVSDMMSRWDGKPINKQDAQSSGIREVNVRYQKNRKVHVIKMGSKLAHLLAEEGVQRRAKSWDGAVVFYAPGVVGPDSNTGPDFMDVDRKGWYVWEDQGSSAPRGFGRWLLHGPFRSKALAEQKAQSEGLRTANSKQAGVISQRDVQLLGHMADLLEEATPTEQARKTLDKIEKPLKELGKRLQKVDWDTLGEEEAHEILALAAKVEEPFDIVDDALRDLRRILLRLSDMIWVILNR